MTGKGKIHVKKTKLFSVFTYNNIVLHCIGIYRLPQTSWIMETPKKKVTINFTTLNWTYSAVKVRKNIKFAVKPSPQKSCLLLDIIRKRGGRVQPESKSCWVVFLGLLFYITRSCITCLNNLKMDISFVSRSRSRSQILNNIFYLEQEPYHREYVSFTLTHIAVIMQL